MTEFAHDGLELWYGTADAPAPEGTTERRDGVTVTVGVRPAGPATTVNVRYRVDGRGVHTLSAPVLAADHARRTRYFRAAFPPFWSGDAVEYLPVASCAGRRAPDPTTAASFPSSFRLDAPRPAAPADQRPGQGAAAPPAFATRLEHLVRANVPLTDQPEIIGQTPEGFVVDWPPVGGTLDGSAFHATVIPGGQHQTTIMTDGMGIVRASVTVRTTDRALILIQHSGMVDYGEQWASNIARGTWLPTMPVRTHIRMLTAEPKYRWLNRLFCVSVGEVRTAEHAYSYDLYAVR